jgi:hypothetical protein
MASEILDSRGQTQPENAQTDPFGGSALPRAHSLDSRQGRTFIHEEEAEDFGSDPTEDEEEGSGYDSQLEAEACADSLTRVEDEDWEIAETGGYVACSGFCHLLC